MEAWHLRDGLVRRIALLILLFNLGVSACLGQSKTPSTIRAGSGLTHPILWQAVPVQPPGTTSVRVYFVTNRAVNAPGTKVSDYSDTLRSGSRTYGQCEVSVPIDRKVGEVRAPFYRRLFFSSDKGITVTSTKVMDRNSFFSDITGKIRSTKGKEALVFVHGFNTSFEDAIERTAQLAYDLKFEGAAISFTWPSYRLSWLQERSLAIPIDIVRRNVLGNSYNGAIENADLAVSQLKEFLSEVRKSTGATTVHLIAHSLGARVLANALFDLAQSGQAKGNTRFRQVILAAADINVDVFEQLARVFPTTAERVTLYVSSSDRVLKTSEVINDHPRAGEGGSQIVVVPSVDSIEASAVDTSMDGHSYYGENKTVIFDIFRLLRGGDPPDQRFGLEPRLATGGKYWIIRP